MKLFFTLCFCFCITLVFGQSLKIKRINIGVRMFEFDAFGNNPTTLTPLLKNQISYLNYINSINYNSLYGGPGPQQVHEYYMNTEIYKDGKTSKFWKKHSVQTGLFISNKIAKGNMGIANVEDFRTQTDTFIIEKKYSINQQLRFAGANLGLNRKIRLGKRVAFIPSFFIQGNIAATHYFNQRLDSTKYSRKPMETTTTLLPKLKGKNYFEWQAMIPLGIEYAVYKNKVFLQAEFIAGTIGSRYRFLYRSKGILNNEAHGFGFWLSYAFN